MKKDSSIKSEGDFYSRKVGNLFLNHQYDHSWPLLASVASIYIKPQIFKGMFNLDSVRQMLGLMIFNNRTLN